MRCAPANAFLLLTCVMALAGCDMMLTEHKVTPFSPHPIVCDSSAGNYALPKSLIRLTIFKQKKDPKEDETADPNFGQVAGRGKVDRYELQKVEVVRREDPRHTYCLRYRGSITAHDKIFVHKTVDKKNADPGDDITLVPVATNRKTNLLHVVASDALDKSGIIAQQLTRTVFKAASFGAARRARARARARRARDIFFSRDVNGTAVGNKVLEIEFDPFDPAQVAWTNEALGKFGFCAMLGGFAVDLNRAGIKQYCDAPKATLRTYPPVVGTQNYLEMLADYQRPLDRPPSGIFYRPEQSYRLYVFGTDNLDIQEREWKLRLLEEVKLENISPILSVQVNRTYFAQRQTTLVFYGGVLKNVCIAKSSELVEIAKLPLLITKSIVALPTQIVEFRLAAVQNQAKLVVAQDAVLAAQDRYLEALRDPRNAKDFKFTRPDPVKAVGVTDDHLNFTGDSLFESDEKTGQDTLTGNFACPKPSSREDKTLTAGVLN